MTTTPLSVAPLRNVALLHALVARLRDRQAGLPGMGTFYGPSGYGKSFAAIFSANKHRAYHVELRSVWTRAHLCRAILAEMGVEPGRTIAEMVDQIGRELARTGRPLLVDEADYLVQKGLIEVIRDLYESSAGAVVLIGEETLPTRLQRHERMHGRMLDWVAAEPPSLQDAAILARMYAPGVEVAPCLLEDLHRASMGSTRRVCVNLARLAEEAATRGLARMTRADWAGAWFSGAAPAPRRG